MISKGQALISTLIILPVLIFTSSMLYKSSSAALYHNQIQSSIDNKALNILLIQARALEALGKINPISASIITTRREVEKLISVLLTTPGGAVKVPPLLRLRTKLIKIQQSIFLKQQNIIKNSSAISQKEAKILFSKRFKGKVTAEVWPKIFKLFIEKKDEFKNEVGAPLKLNSEFNKKQNILIKAQMQTERFLSSFKNDKRFENVSLQSFAQIEMKELEGQWQAHLRLAPGKAL
ncbi:MAG: hypothetical protein IPM57_00540 [Oligoflexia bacterium]|nr:hypothetical protein [Oligoflexia bacterium]